MADQHRKHPRDTNQLAKFIVDVATGEVEDGQVAQDEGGKDRVAVAAGQKGGSKGGPARAHKLSPESRREIARKAAMARWGKND